MPNECITNPLQRELADSIIRMVPLDDIRILLACGAKVNEPVTQGLSPLHYAVWQRYYEAAQLLLTRGSDVNAVDECGYSPLHLSAEHGYAEVLRLLILSGAKVNYRPDTNEPFPRTTQCDEPLRLAIRNKHMGCARMLLESGADPNKRYFFGAEINLVNDLCYLELLLTFGACADSRDRAGLTPLMKAVRQPYGIDAVLLLVKYGADVNAMADERHDYRTVLHYAVLSGNLDIIRLVIKQGAKLNYDVEYGLEKPSPLDLAILKGDLDVVELLIQSGANVNCSSPIIGSPLHVASADNILNRLEILQMLLKAGADPNLKVYNDLYDHNSQLRPVLVEYLASNSEPDFAVVLLLIQYGARVVMKTQFRDPDGILNSLQNVCHHQQQQQQVRHYIRNRNNLSEEELNAIWRKDRIFNLLIEASESFDTCMIRRNNIIGSNKKSILLDLAKYPLSLTKQLRIHLRRIIGGGKLIHAVKEFELPKSLERFLLFDYR